MNIPNKLTLLRVILIPVFIVLFFMSINDTSIISIGTYSISSYRLISAIIFVVASITDYFDGVIARKYHLSTNFGKLMDPLADKMLVISALMMLASHSEIHYIMVLIVVLREISISAIRLVALEQGTVIAASMWGKYKTATQMIAVTLYLFNVCSIGWWPCF
ncbi:MAG: CDP-diacylglycerol--glycerol-3-phosphate 3-phosphatidyltransferase, partial [Lachnospiraceae bacterium]|nr:CDP-diacylglycerol--glycerol-3-phosphate 3-phosphatidyltransferase [Lachnospiraceae bacterium]